MSSLFDPWKVVFCSIRHGENLQGYPGRSSAVLAEHSRQHPDPISIEHKQPRPILDFLSHRPKRDGRKG